MLWLLIIACEINLPQAFVGEDGNLYEQGEEVTIEDTGSDSDALDTAEQDTGNE